MEFNHRIQLEPNSSVLLMLNGVPVTLGCEQRGNERWLYVAARTPTYEATAIGLDARLNFRENQK